MDIRQINSFLTVAQCLNFSNAAMQLQTSVSSISRHIASLEEEWGMQLFIRDHRSVTLTECGSYLYHELEPLYGSYRSILDNARMIHEGYRGSLQFGVLEELSMHGPVQQALDQFQHNYPELQLGFTRYSFRGITDCLLDHTIDLAVTLFFNISNIPTIRYKILSKAEDGILISSRNPMAKHTVFSPEKFRNETFIVMSEQDSSFAYHSTLAFCREHGFYPKLRVAPNLDTAMLWVEAGLGLAFSHKHAVSVMNPGMTFIPLDKDSSVAGSMLVLAWNSTNNNPAIEPFLEMI